MLASFVWKDTPIVFPPPSSSRLGFHYNCHPPFVSSAKFFESSESLVQGLRLPEYTLNGLIFKDASSRAASVKTRAKVEDEIGGWR